MIKAWDYRWSRVHAHLAGKNSQGIILPEKLLSLAGDWQTYLQETQADSGAEFEQHGRRGRPLGSESFIEKTGHLLQRDLKKKNRARRGLWVEIKYCVPLFLPGVADEPGHLFSNEPYRGDDLDQAFKGALSAYDSDVKIGHIYSSMNGERHWAKECGVALIRNAKAFNEEKISVHHPADCYGDLGAATGAVLINLVTEALLTGHSTTPSLIYCSSDHRYRAAVCFEPLPLTAFQMPPITHHTPVKTGSAGL